MKDDDKTVEIILPVLTPTQSVEVKTAHSVSIPARPKHNSHNQPLGIATPTQVAIHPSWVDYLKKELSEDWTLRLLAVLTILVLSLLVL